MNPLFLLAAVPLAAATTAPSVEAMRQHRRVLIVAAPSPADPRLLAQRRALAGWRDAADARDISIVEIVAGHVSGVAEPAVGLRRHWRLPAADFHVVLIGKDGHEALRRSEPIATDTLQRTIDAMPMRRAGLR